MSLDSLKARSVNLIREFHSCLTDKWSGKNYDGQHDEPRDQPRRNPLHKEVTVVDERKTGNARCDAGREARLNNAKDEVTISLWNTAHGSLANHFGAVLSLFKAKRCTRLATKNGIRMNAKRPSKLMGSRGRLSGTLKGKWSTR